MEWGVWAGVVLVMESRSSPADMQLQLVQLIYLMGQKMTSMAEIPF